MAELPGQTRGKSLITVDWLILTLCILSRSLCVELRDSVNGWSSAMLKLGKHKPLPAGLEDYIGAEVGE